MATPTIADLDSGAAEGGSVALSVTATSGDLLVAIYATDFYGPPDSSDLTSSHTWTTQAVDTVAVDSPHVGIFTAPVTTTGAQNVTFAANSDATTYGYLYAISGVDSVEDAAADGAASNSTSHVVPSMDAVTSDALMIAAAAGGGQVEGQDGDYTWPGSMTEQVELDSPPWSSSSSATEVLSSSGATGTRTASYSVATFWAAGGILLGGASSGVTGSGALIAPAGQVTGEGAVSVSGAAAVAAPAASAAGAGSVVITGSGAATAPAGVATGAGTVAQPTVVDLAVTVGATRLRTLAEVVASRSRAPVSAGATRDGWTAGATRSRALATAEATRARDFAEVGDSRDGWTVGDARDGWTVGPTRLEREE